MPDIALRTTFLVGFPGETEQDFQGLLDFIREVRFDHVGAFPFSPQPGTEAARLPDQVPERVKRRRYRELMEAAQADILGAEPRMGRQGDDGAGGVEAGEDGPRRASLRRTLLPRRAGGRWDGSLLGDSHAGGAATGTHHAGAPL